MPRVDLVLTDPPYGMDAVKNSGVLKSRYSDVIEDDSIELAVKAFRFCQNDNKSNFSIWWGANYYASMLPDGSRWLVWNKMNGASDQMDCELAWTDLGGVIRMFSKPSEKKNRFHPTQKPVSLFCWCIDFVNGCKSILDPFLGVGASAVAAKQLNIKFIGIEIEEKYCEMSAIRLRQAVFDVW